MRFWYDANPQVAQPPQSLAYAHESVLAHLWACSKPLQVISGSEELLSTCCFWARCLFQLHLCCQWTSTNKTKTHQQHSAYLIKPHWNHQWMEPLVDWEFLPNASWSANKRQISIEKMCQLVSVTFFSLRIAKLMSAARSWGPGTSSSIEGAFFDFPKRLLF